MPRRSSHLRVVPFTVGCTLLGQRPIRTTFNRMNTETFTALTAALFGDQSDRAGLTVAALGQAYPSELLVPPAVVPATFGAHAAALLRRVSPQLEHGETLPPLLPVCVDSQLASPAFKTKSMVSCPLIGFPCALLGRDKALTAFLQQNGSDLLTPLPPTHPALLALTAFCRTHFGLPREALHITAPLPLHEVQIWHSRLGVPHDVPSLSSLG